MSDAGKKHALTMAVWLTFLVTFLAPFLGWGWAYSVGYLLGGNVPPVLGLGPHSLYGIVLLWALVLASMAGCLYEWHAMRIDRAMTVAKSNFAAAVTHELRTPMAAIRMNVEMLREGIVTEPVARDRCLADIETACGRLGGMVEDVLNFSTMGHGQRTFSFEAVPADALVDEALALLAVPLAASGLQLERDVQVGLVLNVDRHAMVGVLTNLIGNAMKYAAAGKLLQLVLREQGGQIELAVRDFGPGIARTEQRRVFEPFYRSGDEGTRTQPGTGLGLALVQSYVKGHAGSIKLSSQPGKGACFTVRLPRARKAA